MPLSQNNEMMYKMILICFALIYAALNKYTENASLNL